MGKRLRVLVLSVMMLCLSVPVQAAGATDYSDHWAKEEIQTALQAGWVSGYPDGSFRPEETITRAEFTRMLLAAFRLTPDSETVQFMANHSQPQTPLEDMEGHWLTEQGWLQAALVSGLVVSDDYNEHCFRPEKPVSRREIALMTVRALGLVYPAQTQDQPLEAADGEDIPEWVRGYIRLGLEAGILTGYPDGAFRHEGTATRGEAAAMVARAVQYAREGTDETVRVVLRFHHAYDKRQDQKLTLKNVPVLMADGQIYVPARAVFTGWNTLRQKAYGLAPGEVSARWDPIRQTIAFDHQLEWMFQAGNADYEDQGYWTGIQPGRWQLPAPARLLYGEIMIPVCSQTGEETYSYWCQPDAWQWYTNTLRLDLTAPYEPLL
ncbi:MAG: S-layer homology domain-containing protein [Evtepia sp.]